MIEDVKSNRCKNQIHLSILHSNNLQQNLFISYFSPLNIVYVCVKISQIEKRKINFYVDSQKLHSHNVHHVSQIVGLSPFDVLSID